MNTPRARPAAARLASLLGLLLLAPGLAGCTQGADGPDVMASFYPLEFLAEEVAGDSVSVASVVKPGTEPHDYEPTPSDLRRIVEADALIIQGADFEGWLKTAQSQAPSTRLILATEGITFREQEEHHHEGEVEAEPEEHGATDPHTWLDPVLMQDMARNVEFGLAAAYPDQATTFQANREGLVSRLQGLHNEFVAGLADCEVRVIITNHDAFGYLADRYGFEQIAIHGLDPHDEPDPQAIDHVIEEAREHGIDVIFFEDIASPQVAEAIAREVGATTLLLTPIEGIPEDQQAAGKDYFTQMRLNLQNLREGMRCT